MFANPQQGLALQLSPQVWNAIGDLVKRNGGKQEIYFAEVTRADAENKLVWTKDFMDVPIPCISFDYSFAYMDTQPTGDAVDGEPVKSIQVRREDKTHKNANFKVKLICPKKGDLVVVLDPLGAKTFPICVGLLRSKGAWAVGDTAELVLSP